MDVLDFGQGGDALIEASYEGYIEIVNALLAITPIIDVNAATGDGGCTLPSFTRASSIS